MELIVICKIFIGLCGFFIGFLIIKDLFYLSKPLTDDEMGLKHCRYCGSSIPHDKTTCIYCGGRAFDYVKEEEK